ncbi:MAG TPA: hypothetical protein VG496_08875, partial [Myxococcales bacterium]|nr:hypothetical protein [Myxococcales bacterium]
LCHDRLVPARGVIRRQDSGALVALSWEGAETARLFSVRAARALREPLAIDAGPEVRAPPSAQGLEVDAPWTALEEFARREDTAEIALYGMHAGGAFAVLSLGSEGVEQCAGAARSAGASIVAPRRLRNGTATWEQMGAGGVWKRLLAALGAEDPA